MVKSLYLREQFLSCVVAEFRSATSLNARTGVVELRPNRREVPENLRKRLPNY